MTFQNLCARIRKVTGEDTLRRSEGLVAKIHQTLQPGIAEMFFARVPILVEGLEDVSYITTELHLSELWPEFRRLGCHLIPAHGKGKMILPLAIAIELSMPIFVLFDADGDNQNQWQRPQHEKDNKALMGLLGIHELPFPNASVWGANHAIWQTNLTKTVKDDFPEADYFRITEAARQRYGQEGGLEKNDLFITDWLAAARREGLSSGTLAQVCQSIIAFAKGL